MEVFFFLSLSFFVVTCYWFVQSCFCRLAFSGKKKSLPQSLNLCDLSGPVLITPVAKASKHFSANSGDNWSGSIYLPEWGRTVISCIGCFGVTWSSLGLERMGGEVKWQDGGPFQTAESCPRCGFVRSPLLWRSFRGQRTEGTWLGAQHTVLCSINICWFYWCLFPCWKILFFRKDWEICNRYLLKCH